MRPRKEVRSENQLKGRLISASVGSLGKQGRGLFFHRLQPRRLVDGGVQSI
jgi:hypothetical protein